MTEPNIDTPLIRSGAAEYVACPTCGAEPGALCTFHTVRGPEPTVAAHVGRRMEYAEGRGLIYPEPTRILPEIWRQCQQGRHAECKPHPASCKCAVPPPACECPCHNKSTNVDDLLG